MAVSVPNVTDFFAGNAAWAANLTAAQPDFLPTLAKSQAPPLVWIGCGDSRVPESVILDVLPGQVFTTRNIANQFHDDDDSAKAVLEYGVHHLNASHVAVVGHTNCGGAKAAYDSPKPEDEEVTPTRGQQGKKKKCKGKHGNGHGNGHGKDHGKGNGHGHGGEDEDGEEEEEDTSAEALNRFLAPLIKLRHQLPANATVDDLIVANVQTTVNKVVNSTTIQHAWEVGQKVCVHGWVYDLATGLLKDLGVSKCK